MTGFMDVGFHSYIPVDRLIMIIDPESSPIRKLRMRAQKRGMLIAANKNRMQQSCIVLDNGMIVVSSVQPATLIRRFLKERGKK